MKILCVIPARLGSTRLPQKPLVLLRNKPMIQWTYEAAMQCEMITKVIVATDSDEIADVILSCGGAVEMTDPHIKTGTDRTAVVAQRYPEMDVIINLQGDEPFIQASMLTTLVTPFLNKVLNKENIVMSTLAFPLSSNIKRDDPNVVKVLLDKNHNAIYFSRAPIPYFRVSPNSVLPIFHHMGVYAFEKNFLQTFTQLSQTPFELTESLEQLRALENGYSIRVCLTEQQTVEINTPEDLDAARQWLSSSPPLKK